MKAMLAIGAATVVVAALLTAGPAQAVTTEPMSVHIPATRLSDVDLYL